MPDLGRNSAEFYRIDLEARTAAPEIRDKAQADASSFFHDFEVSARVKTINRPPSRTSYAILYGMSKGYNLDEIENMSKEEKLSLGDEAVQFLRDHPTSLDSAYKAGLTKEDIAENQRLHGEVYRKAADMLLKEKLPEFDAEHPENISETDRNRIRLMESLCVDHAQSKDTLKKTGGFVAGYGGFNNMEEIDNKLMVFRQYNGMLITAFQPDNVRNAQAAKEVIYKCHTDELKEMSGLTVEEVDKVARDKGYDFHALASEIVPLKSAVNDADFYKENREATREEAREIMNSVSDQLESDAMDARTRGAQLNAEGIGRPFEEYSFSEKCNFKSRESLKSFFPEFKEEMADKNGIRDFDPSGKLENSEAGLSEDGSQWEIENVFFYNALKGNVLQNATPEVLKDGLGGLGTLAALKFMYDNPDTRLTDIMDNRLENADKMREAGKFVLSAFENSAEGERKMSRLIAQASVAAANINPTREALHAVGADEGLNGKAAEAELLKPENRMKVSGILAGIGRLVENALPLLENITPGRHKPGTPFTEDKGDFDTGRAARVYQGAREAMSIQDQREYQGISVRRDQRDILLKSFDQYENMIQGLDYYKAADVAAFEKSVSAVAENAAPLHSVSKKAVLQADYTKRLVESEKIILKEGKNSVYLGLKESDEAKIQKAAEESQLDKPPQKPTMGRWANFWSSRGFYKDKLAEYNEQMKAYDKKMSDRFAQEQKEMEAEARLIEKEVKERGATNIIAEHEGMNNRGNAVRKVDLATLKARQNPESHKTKTTTKALTPMVNKHEQKLSMGSKSK